MGRPAAAHPDRAVTGSGDGSTPDDPSADTESAADIPVAAEGEQGDAAGTGSRAGDPSGESTDAPESVDSPATTSAADTSEPVDAPAVATTSGSAEPADITGDDVAAIGSANPVDTGTTTDAGAGESDSSGLTGPEEPAGPLPGTGGGDGEAATEESGADSAESPSARPVATVDEHTGSAGDPPPAGRRRRLVTVLTVLVVLLLGTTSWAAVTWLGDRAETERTTAALDAARNAGAVLTTIDQATAEQDIQAVVDASTGEFGDLFRSNTEAYVGVVRDGEVSSTGKVEEAGLQSIEGDTAKALVAVSSTVKNKAVPEGEPRYYRMLIQLQHQDDGRWLVSQVEFVP